MLRFKHLSGLRAWALALGVFTCILVGDLASGSDLRLRALYVVPVGIAAWTTGRRGGVTLSLLSVTGNLSYDIAVGLTHEHPMFFYSDAAIRLGVYVGVSWVLCALHDAYARLEELSQTDPLTRLYNRRGFAQLVERELLRARRTGEALTIIHIDLDGFKAVNDSHGHAAGDAILVAVGDTLAAGRATDIAARVGGDEFALLLQHVRGAGVARAMTRIVAELTRSMRGGGWPITFSIGVATFPVPPATVEDMIAAADALMYEVKRGGKNGVRHREIGLEALQNAIVA